MDAITAIEAILRLDIELSFRSSFQVAGLLAQNDDERIKIFDEMRGYYDTRSKVVHGGDLKPKHVEIISNHEQLVEFVRRLLRGFIWLVIKDEVSEGFYKSLDGLLQHSSKRSELRMKMGLN